MVRLASFLRIMTVYSSNKQGPGTQILWIQSGIQILKKLKTLSLSNYKNHYTYLLCCCFIWVSTTC